MLIGNLLRARHLLESGVTATSRTANLSRLTDWAMKLLHLYDIVRNEVYVHKYRKQTCI